jgi:GH25 family lysozyme M1 (1,4-beta-N-acetylmuramidase)
MLDARRRPFVRLAAVSALAALTALPATAATRAGGVRDGAAGSSGEAARSAPSDGSGATVGARLGATVAGLDVSHWQGEIDWKAVAADGQRFVFLKATDDVDYVDPTFVVNRSEARSNGLLVGAYHFARPDPSRGDARREARHFVAIAHPGPGDLLPVLDMETSRGLNHDGVTRWARTWVRVVRDRTGVTPLVYTSPYGWASRTGDTPLLARDGAPLWIAHWGVSSPTVPADGWDGHGWAVWQHTSTGHVPGVGGDVDLDLISGSRLGVITIRRLALEVTGGAGRITSRPAGLGCAESCARSVDPDATVTLTAVPDDHAFFTGWTGACAGTDPTCTVSMRASRFVGARFITDVAAPTATITPPGGLLGPVAIAFEEPVRGVGPASLVLRTSGGGRVDAHRTCRARSGVAVACGTAVVRSVSLRPRSPLVPGRSYEVSVNPDGAAPTIRDGAGNVAATETAAFAAARSVEQTSPAVRRSPRAAWSSVHAAGASAGSYTVARRAGAAVRVAFDGPGIDVIAVTGPAGGRARVYVDGELVRTLDLFSASRTFEQVRRIDGLSDATHVLRIVATGHSRPAATGTAVALDRVDVSG